MLLTFDLHSSDKLICDITVLLETQVYYCVIEIFLDGQTKMQQNSAQVVSFPRINFDDDVQG